MSVTTPNPTRKHPRSGGATGRARKLRTQRQRPASLTDKAYARLEERIITLQLAPGTAVSTVALSEMIGIGRTPVREALQRLVREGLIVVLPQRGTLVSDIDLPMQLRLLEVRREVERLIVRLVARRATAEERGKFAALAARFAATAKARTIRDAKIFMRADHEFNDLCLQAARNEFAAGAIGLMHGLCRRFFFAHWQEAQVLEVSAQAHAALALALAAGDEDTAALALDSVMNCTEAITRTAVSAEH